MAYIGEDEEFIYVKPEGFTCGSNPYKEKENQLAKDLKCYNLPQRIVDRSIEIYIMIMKAVTLKRGRRRGMMCKCVYEAYKENNIPKDPILLAMLFQIDLKQLREAQDEFYSRIYGTDLAAKFPKRHLTAKELLPDIAAAMGIANPPIEDLVTLIDLLYVSTGLLSRVSPRDVAICALHWYSNKHYEKIDAEFTQSKTLIAYAKLVKNVAIIETIT